MSITFHRTLHAFLSALSDTSGDHLDHAYVVWVELTHRHPLPIRECWEEVVQELAVVGVVSPGPEHEEANNPLSSAIRFLHRLEEELLPIHFDFIVDSDSVTVQVPLELLGESGALGSAYVLPPC